MIDAFAAEQDLLTKAGLTRPARSPPGGLMYIGLGGPQWTGLDGYETRERRTGLPTLKLELQMEDRAAFLT